MTDSIQPAQPDRFGIVAHARVAPVNSLAVLSQREVNTLCQRRTPALESLFHRCALAVLSSGLEVDDARLLNERYPDRRFEVVNTGLTGMNSHGVFPIAKACTRFDPD